MCHIMCAIYIIVVYILKGKSTTEVNVRKGKFLFLVSVLLCVHVELQRQHAYITVMCYAIK